MADYFQGYCTSCNQIRKVCLSNRDDDMHYCTYCEVYFVPEDAKSAVRIIIEITSSEMSSNNTQEFLRVAKLLGVSQDRNITFTSGKASFNISADFLLTCVDLQQILNERGADLRDRKSA